MQKKLQDTFFSQPLFDTQLKKTSASASHTLLFFWVFKFSRLILYVFFCSFWPRNFKGKKKIEQKRKRFFLNLRRDCDILSKKMYVILRQELFVVLNSSWCIYNFPLHKSLKRPLQALKRPKKVLKRPQVKMKSWWKEKTIMKFYF